MFSLVVASSLLAVAHCAPLTEDAFVVPGLKIPVETPQEKFVRVDVNRDKIVTFDEFLHMDFVYEQAKKEEFNVMDVNRDGRLAKEEYDEHYRQMNSRSDNLRASYFSDIFREFDTNQDKSLSTDEIRELLHKRFLVEPRPNFPQIVYGFDTDHSGGLDLFEYMKLDEKFPFDQTDPLNKAAPLPPVLKADKLPLVNLNKPIF